MNQPHKPPAALHVVIMIIVRAKWTRWCFLICPVLSSEFRRRVTLAQNKDFIIFNFNLFLENCCLSRTRSSRELIESIHVYKYIYYIYMYLHRACLVGSDRGWKKTQIASSKMISQMISKRECIPNSDPLSSSAGPVDPICSSSSDSISTDVLQRSLGCSIALNG